MTKLTDQEKIELVTQLAQAGIVKFQTNCLNEMEIIPNHMNKEEYYWLLNENYDITEKDVDLFQQCLVHMHKKGIHNAKHEPTEY